MKPEEQRIAIAKACGWTHFEPDTIQYTARRADGKWGKILDYPNSLDAMHEAEKMLAKKSGYHEIGGYGLYLVALENNVSATAAQRAEAFLRALNLWKE